MRTRAKSLGVQLRPHLKTAKSIDIARLALAGLPQAITVSTVAEAEYFGKQGIPDIFYAVGIVPDKVPRLAALSRLGVQISVTLDDLQNARAVGHACLEHGIELEVVVEINSDDHRSGVDADSAYLIELANVIRATPGLSFKGVMTHAGESYRQRSSTDIKRIAEVERAAVVLAAQRLGAAGIGCRCISVGSTPTAVCAAHLDGVTELRTGVYMFNDLFQAGLSVCDIEDIAVSVLASVIHHKTSLGRLLLDAGALALSKDRGTALQAKDRGYGMVMDLEGGVHDDLIVTEVNQEHGIVVAKKSDVIWDRFPVASKVRILPNHVCMTAAAHDGYYVLDDTGLVVEYWERCHGW